MSPGANRVWLLSGLGLSDQSGDFFASADCFRAEHRRLESKRVQANTLPGTTHQAQFELESNVFV